MPAAELTSRPIRRALLGAAAVIALGVVMIHVVAPRVLLERLNTRLERMPEHVGAFDDAEVRWWTGSVRLKGLSIRAQRASREMPALIEAPVVDVSIASLMGGSEGMRADLLARSPVVTLIADRDGRLLQFGFGPDWVQLVQDLVPLPIEQLRFENATMVLWSGTNRASPNKIRVSRAQGAIRRSEDDAAVIGRLEGELQGSGTIMLDAKSASADPMRQSHLALALSDVLLAPHAETVRSVTGIAIREGRMQAQAELDVRQGIVSGRVEATLSRLQFGDGSDTEPLEWLTQRLLAAGVAVIGSGEHDTFRVEIPVKGPLASPQTRTLAGLLNVLQQLATAPFEWRILGERSADDEGGRPSVQQRVPSRRPSVPSAPSNGTAR